ncbi:iron ABC transporter permease [Arachnia propionica]|nr:iron ABC transporter permease [Arachnia propionica]
MRPSVPETRATARRPSRWLGATAVLIIVLMPVSLVVGTVEISLGQAWAALARFDPGVTEHLLIREVRVPRTLLALLVGAGLGSAGVVMQALTRNPLAEPGLLGINAGVTLAVAVSIAFLGFSSLGASQAFGFLGAAVTGAAVHALGGVRHGAGVVRLVLAGAAVNVVLLATTRIILVNMDPQLFGRFRTWTVGSLEGRGFDVLAPTALAVVIGVALALALSGALDASALGQDLSRSLGVNPTVVLSLSALVVVILCGAVTVAAGPIGFVGLTAPALGRFVVGLNHRRLIPATSLLAAALVLLADVAGRTVIPNAEIGVGIMISLIGAPTFIAMVRHRRVAQL